MAKGKGKKRVKPHAGYIELTVKLYREDDQWTAVCEELGTSTCADGFDEAAEAIEQLIALHLNSLEDVGARDAFFKEHGITFHRGTPKRHMHQAEIRPGEYVTKLMERIPQLA